MLAVETSRRSGKLERALDWVILWLKALGDKITEHMSEPVSLWAKTKADAARNSDEDVRLRYGTILLFFLFFFSSFFFKLWNGLKNRFFSEDHFQTAVLLTLCQDTAGWFWPGRP